MGSGFKVDTSKKFSVVTQFITSDNTDTGDLVEIKRLFVQDGNVIENPKSTFDTLTDYDSLTDDYCAAQKTLFGDNDQHTAKGGIKSMGNSFERGMVLVMSIWDDHDVDMLWLDSDYPPNKSGPGVSRGSCSVDSGKPSDVESQYADAYVSYGNIRYGDIGSTYSGGPGPTPPSPGNCPGGDLSSCIGLCPSDATAYQACVAECVKRCSSTEQFLQY